jgi:hypothetical protein
VTTRGTDKKVIAEIIASSSTKVVKDAPFSAEGVSESVQTLPDGNKIARSTITKMYRDSDGRFRRKGSGSSGGFPVVSNVVPFTGFQDTISIYDPVEGVRYVLNPSTKSARRFNNQNILTEGAVIVDGQSMSPSIRTRIETSAAQKSHVIVSTLPNLGTGTISGGNTGQLGTKSFEGVTAEGTRTVTVIEAGKIGNEKPIEIVYERWYSKEFDLIV